ncbi:MAG TPA: hypothetical protein VF795_04950 [Desulfuromonadaceae bacterium]
MPRRTDKKKSFVISMRITTEEKNALQQVMRTRHIGSMTDLIRQAIELVKQTPLDDDYRQFNGDRLPDKSHQDFTRISRPYE